MSYLPDPNPFSFADPPIPVPNLAAPWKRIVGWIIDNVLVMGMVGLVGGWWTIQEENAGRDVDWTMFWAVMAIVTVSYHVVPIALWGQTLGKKITGTRVVKAADLSKAGWLTAIRRWAPYVVLGMIPGVGSLLACILMPLAGLIMLFANGSRQTPHDLVANSLVVDSH